jgi:hypothetical protein
MAMLRPGPTIIDYLLVSIDFGDNDNYQLSFGDNLSEPSLVAMNEGVSDFNIL